MNVLFDSDPVATRLSDLGYQPAETLREFSSDGTTRREWAVQALRPIRIPNGSAEFTPPQNCVVLTFEYASGNWPERYSKIATRVADGLVKLLASRDGPLVRRTVRSLEFMYRLDENMCPRLDDPTLSYAAELYPHGLVARDCNSSLVLGTGCAEVPVGDDSEWLAGRSPLSVARTELPLLDADAASVAIVALVERFAAAGDLRICGRYLEPATASGGPQYGDLAISTDPASWDPADPRRKAPGLIERVRALRERIMGVPSRAIDNDQLAEKLEQQRAARTPGIYAPWLD